MPDYQLKRWDENNFDVDSVVWVKEALEKKKWSLASDYIRHYAVYTEGGIYLDTDVMAYKPFDDFLHYDFFTAVELHPEIYDTAGRFQVDEQGNPLQQGTSVAGIGLLAAAYGAVEGNSFVKECMDFFGTRHFIRPDGTLFEDEINPSIMARLLYPHGFRYVDQLQRLEENMVVFPSSVLAGNAATRTPDSYLMHWCDGSWRDWGWKHRVRQFLLTHFPSVFRK